MEGKIINIKDISTYREELMGWSILWIMMLHYTFNQIKPIGFIAQYGFAGVDIFLFVSGLGLYYSLEKNNNILHFYRKRLLRIFPTYYILGVFASLILFPDNIITYLFRYTTIGFWTNGIYWEWYIPSLVILYLIAPFFKRTLSKKLFPILGSIVICSWTLAYLLIDREDLLNREHFFFLYRIPAFIFGMVCAYWIKNEISTKYYLYILCAGIPIFALLFPHHHHNYNYKYLSLIFLLPFFTSSFIVISKCMRFINPVLSAMGKASLEIYLIQGIFFSAILMGILPVSTTWHDATTIMLIILSSILGILVHWFIGKIDFLRFL